MKIQISIASIFATIFSATIFAAPVEFDTPDAHIVVMRALDSWSGDNGASEDSLEAVAKHKAGFVLGSSKGPRYDTLGFPLLFGLNSDAKNSPVVQGVVESLKPLNFKLAQLSVDFKVEAPIALESAKLADFVKYQRELYKSVVISSGNPATLHNSVAARKFFSGLLAIGTVVVAGDKYGSLGSEAMLGSGIPGDIYQFSSTSRAALTPLDLSLSSYDPASYKFIDVRRVIQGNNERLGQVIIAYKNDKTEAAENEALIKAIVSLTGADTTIESIQKSRNEDLAKRQAIWDTCVSDGKCKKD